MDPKELQLLWSSNYLVCSGNKQIGHFSRKTENRAARVAQQFSATFSPGPDPGPGIESHVRLPVGSLLLPLPMTLPLSVFLNLS